MLDEQPVLQQGEDGEHSHNGRGAGGSPLMLAKALVRYVVEHQNTAQNGMCHGFSSS
jgi:hypothetical protein